MARLGKRQGAGREISDPWDDHAIVRSRRASRTRGGEDCALCASRRTRKRNCRRRLRLCHHGYNQGDPSHDRLGKIQVAGRGRPHRVQAAVGPRRRCVTDHLEPTQRVPANRMNIHEATTRYEKWVASCIPLDRSALSFKHRQMALGLFPFLRATFYRWIQIWRETADEAARAPALLAVGDLHIENFGTWRDIEGRLIWGINDFDEVYSMPYTVDLVRLATSAHAATAEEHLSIRPRLASDAILEGYQDALK